MRSVADRLVALAIGAVMLGFYRATLAPSLIHPPGDSQELTVVVASLGLTHPTGYPLYTWVGWLFTRLWPFGEIAHRTNLLSAVLGAGGVGMLYLVARTLGLARPAAVVGSLLFGVSTTFWSQAVQTEVYAPNVLAMTFTLWLALRWAVAVEHDGPGAASDRRFVGFAFVYGLSLGAHMSNLGFAPAYALFTLLVDPRILTRPRTVALAVGGFVLAAAQFLWVPFRATAGDLYPNGAPQTLAAVYGYTLGAFTNLRFGFPVGALPSRMAFWVNLLGANFSTAGILLGLLGMWTLLQREPKRFWLLVSMYATHVVFFSQLLVTDPDVFFIASHVLFALFVAFAVDALLRAIGQRVPMPHIASIAAVLIFAAPLVQLARASYQANDRSNETATRDFYDSVFDVLPSQSVLLAKGRGAFGAAVTYQRRHRRDRPDVLVGTELGAPPPSPGVETFVAQLRPPIGLRPGYLPREPRYVAVLRGARHPLVLYRVEDATQPGVEPVAFPPGARVEHDLGAATLTAFDVVMRRSYRPARVSLRLRWRVRDDPSPPIVTTRVGDVVVEAHELNIDPAEGAAPGAQRVVAESFDLVVPWQLDTGTQALAIGVVELAPTGIQTRWLPIGQVVIE